MSTQEISEVDKYGTTEQVHASISALLPAPDAPEARFAGTHPAFSAASIPMPLAEGTSLCLTRLD